MVVYGNLSRLKFFWQYLDEKNPEIRDEHYGYGYNPLNFVSEIKKYDVLEFMTSAVKNAPT